MIAFDYGPSSFAEPEPMGEAVHDNTALVTGTLESSDLPCRHDIAVTPWQHKVMRKIVAKETGAVDGKDYVLLGISTR